MKRIFTFIGFICFLCFFASAGYAQDVPNGDKMLSVAEDDRKIIGISPKYPVAVEYLYDEERLQEVLRDFFRREYPGNKFQAMNELMVKFGFGLFEEQNEDEIVHDETLGILGVYDDDKKIIYIVSSELFTKLQDKEYDRCNVKRMAYSNTEWEDWMNKHQDDIVLHHEVMHALQDQEFNLTEIRKKYRNNDDAYFAIKSVIEGQAELVEEKHLLTALNIGDFPSFTYEYLSAQWDMRIFSKIDAMLEDAMKHNINNTCKTEDLTFLWWISTIPYMFGKLHMEKIEMEKGIKQTSEMFKRCPLSSEQIMNTEKFYNPESEDPPTFINLPSFDDVLNTTAWRYLDYNSLGQLKLYLLCRDLVFDPETVCHPVTQGWDGDRYLVWQNEDDEFLIVWYTTWDSEEDAKEFYDYYINAWERKGLTNGKVSSGDNWRRVLAGADSMYMEERGKDVIIIEGPLDEEGFDKMSQKLWSATKYEATYDICTMTAEQFNDSYTGFTGEDEKDNISSDTENPAPENDSDNTTKNEDGAENEGN